MNVGDYVSAREHLDTLSRQVPKADYVLTVWQPSIA